MFIIFNFDENEIPRFLQLKVRRWLKTFFLLLSVKRMDEKSKTKRVHIPGMENSKIEMGVEKSEPNQVN